MIKAQSAAEGAGSSDTVATCKALVQSLRATNATQLDSATLQVCAKADEYLVDESVLLCQQDKGLKFGIWANVISKTFRGPAKPIVFKELGLQVKQMFSFLRVLRAITFAGLSKFGQVDIPKQINQMKIALRVAHFPYDSVSHLATHAHDCLVVGGTILVDLLYLAPPPKTLKKNWIMRSALSEWIYLFLMQAHFSR